MNPFHLAFPVHDLAAARSFYGDVLGCEEGRSSACWVDFNFAGHQIVAHLDPGMAAKGATNTVDGDDVPIFHFGMILDFDGFEALATRLTEMDATFIIEPRTRFAGEPGEQRTMFVRDPSGNALEFKAFADKRQIFAKD
ncbi:MAG: VOC family protein [Sphingomonas sp.]|nr:VOC family protein [Sphingomonas sp.]RZV49353.1 MAG: glyoxalase [Sphingomonadaceae bacterium]